MKIFNKNHKEETFLDLEYGCDGIAVVAKNIDGTELYRILSISDRGLKIHQLQNFLNKTPFPICPRPYGTSYDVNELGIKLIK